MASLNVNWGPAVQPDELLAVELELDGQNGADGTRPGLGVAADPAELGVLEDRRVVIRRLFRLPVEPQARGESLGGHCSSLM